MKTLPNYSIYYQNLETNFITWLTTLGYQETTVYSHQSHLRELLIYVHDRGSEITKPLLEEFKNYLPNRPNQRGGALAATTVESKYNTLRLLLEYLKLVEGISINVNLPRSKTERGKRVALSYEKIQKIYEVIDEGADRLRDRAIMAIYYGCGLRRREGMFLELGDLLLAKKLLLVRKGKGGKQRYVPMSSQVIADLKAYIYQDRYPLKSGERPYLFVSRKRNRLSGVSYDRRLHHWKAVAQIEEPLSLHVLRHSIATHLLQRGMKLGIVSRFLGHASLVSTQVYTHLLKTENDDLPGIFTIQKEK